MRVEEEPPSDACCQHAVAERQRELQLLRAELETQMLELARRQMAEMEAVKGQMEEMKGDMARLELELAKVRQELSDKKLARTTQQMERLKAKTQDTGTSRAVDEEKAVDKWMETYSCSALASKTKPLPPLILAVRTGRTDVVKHFAKFGENMEVVDENGDTPLLYAVGKLDLDMVKCLAQVGANPDACRGVTGYANNYGNGKVWIPALHIAVAKGAVEMVEALLAAGANVNIAAFHGHVRDETALHIAKDEGMVRALLRAPGVDVNMVRTRHDDGPCETPLLISLQAQRWKVASLLLEAGAMVNAEGCHSATREAILGNVELVELMLEKGAAMDTQGKCLISAVRRDLVPVVEALLGGEAGASARYRLGDNYLSEALHLAVQANKRGLVERLLQAGANPNAVPTWTSSPGPRPELPPLYAAVMSKSLELVKCLLTAGADPNKVEGYLYKKEPLVFIAVQSSTLEIVECLVQAGADVHAAYEDARTYPYCKKTTILDVARSRPEMMKYLQSLGV
eukprot:jgi/Mesvir1/7143/Mv26098-RA.1